MKKTKVNKVALRTQRKVFDLVGIDFSTTGTKVVRLKKTRGGDVSLIGMDILPPVDLTTTKCSLSLPKQLTTHYVNVVYSGTEAMARVLNAPLSTDEKMLSDKKLRESLHVSEEYRVSATILKKGKPRQDSMFLVAAVPNSIITSVLSFFEIGSPAVASVEVAGVAFISAFLHAYGKKVKDKAVCIVEFGESTTYFAFLNKGMVLLVGKFGIGAATMRDKISADLGLDEDLTQTIIVDRSIDVSSPITNVMMPILKQLSISKDFVERYQTCEIEKLYISGDRDLLSCWTQEVAQFLQVDVVSWNPLENIRCEKGVIPKEFSDKISSFAVAIGAAIGGLEE
jgi:Tfp pilus assembly PilM family ATPase